MTVLDLLALFFGILGVLLTIKEVLLGWIVGIVSVKQIEFCVQWMLQVDLDNQLLASDLMGQLPK